MILINIAIEMSHAIEKLATNIKFLSVATTQLIFN